MQALGDFLGVAFVVELEQAGEDFAAGRFDDREANPLFRLVKAVFEIKIVPALNSRNSQVHLSTKLPKTTYVVGRVAWIMNLII